MEQGMKAIGKWRSARLKINQKKRRYCKKGGFIAATKFSSMGTSGKI